MFSYSQTLSHFRPSNVVIWLTMAFQAGSINTGGYLACHRFVSHVTGFGTLIGEEAAIGHFKNSMNMATVPGFFIGGAMLSAFLIDRRIQTGKPPLYPIVMLLILILTLSVTYFGQWGSFGEFGAETINNEHILLASLCLICGLLNATVTSAFGAIIRTTHLTGIVTDLGIGLVRVLTHSHQIQPRTNEVRANWMRAGIISFFVLGCYVSALVYTKVQYWGFLIPAGIATILLLWSLIHFKSHKGNQRQ